MRSKIAGIGQALPPRVLSNAELEKMVETSDEWIVERTGIRERRILAEDLCTSDLAAEAGRAACEHAGIKPSQLDAIILGTVTPDMPMPATAAFVQQKLGAGNCPAFDISAACAGFVFGLSLADSLVARGTYQRILVIGVEILSRVMDWTDRQTCVLFGDGAGAAVVTRSDDDQRGILDIDIHTDGKYGPDLVMEAGGSRKPASHETVEKKQHFVQMNGRQIFVQAVKNMSAASQVLLARNSLTADDISLVIAHQANIRIIEGVAQRTGIPMERFYNSIHRYGNTSSASIPIGLVDAFGEGRVNDGDLLLLTALGAGVSWGAALVRW